MSARNKLTLTYKLAQVLIPSRHNKYSPWISNVPGLLTAAVVLSLVHVVASGLVVDRFGFVQSDVSQQTTSLLNAVNQKRSKHGLAGLTNDSRLDMAASKKAQHMIENNYWAHVSPDGVGPWSFIQNEKYFYSMSAENLARGFRTAEGVIDGWYASDTHREAMLSEDYSEVGFGVKRGHLGGDYTTIYVAMFAKPLSGAAILSGENNQGALALQANHSRTNQASESITFSLVNPLSLSSTLTLPGKISLSVMLLLAVIYVLQIIMLRHKKLVWPKGIVDRPEFKLGLLFFFALLLVSTSFGSIR